jgi:dipeptidyl aminopeptidase/acylaminoacyl peptidase
VFYQVGGRPNPIEIRTVALDVNTGTVSEAVVPGQDSSHDYTNPIWSPDGKYLAFLAEPRTSGGGPSIVIRDVTSGQTAHRLEPPVDSIGGMRWAPDGKSFLALVSVMGRYTISRIDSRTAVVSAIVSNPIGPVLLIRGPEWSADGTRVLYRHRRGTVQAWYEVLVEHDLKTHSERDVYALPSGAFGSYKVSPDGQLVAARTPSKTVVITLATGEARDLLEPAGDVQGWSADGRTVFLARGRFPAEVDIVRVPVAGGEPLVGPRMPRGWGIDLDRSGRKAAFFTNDDGAVRRTEIWRLDNVEVALRSGR